jgi:hypothetical protein
MAWSVPAGASVDEMRVVRTIPLAGSGDGASVHSQAEPVADAATATIMIRRRRDALLGGFLLAIASLWIVVPLGGLLLDPSAGLPYQGNPGTVVAFLVGAALALLAVSWIVRCQVLVIDQGLVRMTDRRLTGELHGRLERARDVRRLCQCLRPQMHRSRPGLSDVRLFGRTGSVTPHARAG